jgi:hypothetical protein
MLFAANATCAELCAELKEENRAGIRLTCEYGE